MTPSRGEQPQTALYEGIRISSPFTGFCSTQVVESDRSNLGGFEDPPSRGILPELTLPTDQLAELESSIDIFETKLQFMGSSGLTAPALIKLHARGKFSMVLVTNTSS